MGLREVPSLNRALAGKHTSRESRENTHLTRSIVTQLRYRSLRGSGHRCIKDPDCSQCEAPNEPQKVQKMPMGTWRAGTRSAGCSGTSVGITHWKRAGVGGHARHCCRMVSTSKITTATFNSPEFFSVAKVLEDLFALPGPPNEPPP